MKMVRGPSRRAKLMDFRPDHIVFVGRFMKDGTDHESYIRKYLSLSSDVSNRRLMERILLLFWTVGTALNIVRRSADL